MKMTTPTLVVCEDGSEYIDRFRRFFPAPYTLTPATDLAAARAACAAGADALLLDLDFRRTPHERLVDEQGTTSPIRPTSERQRIASVQGIFILRALRMAHVTAPALLFADLDDAGRVQFLERSLAPLHVVPSSTGLAEVMRLIAGALQTR